MESEEEIIRGGKAADVLDSAIFIEARQRVTEGIQRQMKAVPLSDQVMHTRLILALQVWDQLEKYLDNVKQTGEMRDFEIQQEEVRKSRFKLWGNS